MVSRVSPSSQPTHSQAPPFDVRLININPHMAIILMNVGKNLVEDVPLDGESGVNIIMKDLRKKIGLLILKHAPLGW